MAVKKQAKTSDKTAEKTKDLKKDVKKDVKVETKAAPKKARKPVIDSSPFCVYIGPNIRGLVRTNAIYEGAKDDVKKQLAEVIEQYPLVDKLISPSESFVNDRIKVKTADNALGVYYKELEQQIKGVRTNG